MIQAHSNRIVYRTMGRRKNPDTGQVYIAIAPGRGVLDGEEAIEIECPSRLWKVSDEAVDVWVAKYLAQSQGKVRSGTMKAEFQSIAFESWNYRQRP